MTGCVLAALVLVGWFIKAISFHQPTLVTILGEGRVKAEPEVVEFTVSIVNMAGTATLALADNNRLTRELVSQVKARGVEKRDIQTAYVRVIPPSTALGRNDYQAVNAIDVTLKDITQLDDLVNSLYAAGARTITNIVFSTQNLRELEREAVAEAVEDAKARVLEIAKASRKKLGRIVSIRTEEAGEAGALAGEVAPESTFEGLISTSPSRIEIVRQATVVFELR